MLAMLKKTWDERQGKLRRTALPLYILLLAACLALLPCHAHAAPPQALVLHSYHQGFTWTDGIMETMAAALLRAAPDVEITVEYMDSKRHAPSTVFGKLAELFAAKYTGKKFNVILVSDDNALDFMLSYRDRLFPATPVVFCGINNYDDKRIAGHAGYTGVVEDFDLAATLELGLKLHPKTKTAAVVSDATDTGLANRERFRAVAQDFAGRVEFLELHDKAADQLVAELKALPADSLILFLSFYRDATGKTFGTREMIELITRASARPVYSAWDFLLGAGVAGGKMVSSRKQGETAGLIAGRILRGERPDAIPVVRESPNEYMFDYARLAPYGISLADLPAGSVVVNRPVSFYFNYKALTWSMGALVTGLLALVAALVWGAMQRRRVARERDNQLDFLQTVIDTIPAPIYYKDCDGEYKGCNQAFETLLGKSKAEIVGKTVKDLSSPDKAAFFQQKDAELLQHPKPQSFEASIVNADSHRDVIFNKAVYRDAAGRVAGLVGVITDITAHKAAESKLKEALDEIEAILDNSLMGIAYTLDWNIVKINARGAEMFGYAPIELLGVNASRLHLPETLDAFVESFRKSIRETGRFTAEHPFRRKDGATVWCQVYAKSKFSGDTERGVIWAWDEVTERRGMEEDLRHAKELAESANLAQSQFLANMSHEIRTPLNGILGMADLTLKTPLTEEQRRNLELIRNSGRGLLRLLSDLLDFTRIEAGQLEITLENFDLPQLVRSATQLFSTETMKKGVHLNVDIDPELPDLVRGDPARLRQILVNLLGNAIKFTEQGAIDVLAQPDRTATLTGTGHGAPVKAVAITVSDTGCGIPAEKIDSIFDSFNHADNFLSRRHAGVGLGLSLTKRLVVMLHGKILVQSEPGSGSTFTVILPIEPALPRAEPLVLAATNRKIAPLRILVAEDNSTNLAYLRRILEDEGHSVVCAENGLEVLDALATQAFDCVLMDVQMPEMDGIETTRRIRSGRALVPNPSIPIFAVTAHALQGDKESFLAAGMNGYISKPVEIGHLLHMLATVAVE